MQYRTFGKTGWQVSEIGHGMWGLAGWTGNDETETGKSLDLSVEKGCNFSIPPGAMGPARANRS